MKRYLTILMIICGVHSLVFSQTKNSFTFGFGIGGTASNVFYPFKVSYADESTAFSQSSEAKSMYGLSFGISAEYYFSERWSINGGLIYDQKGSGNIFLSRTATSGYAYHLNYITIPLMMGFHFGTNRNWYCNFGIYEASLSNIGGPADMAGSAKNAFSTEDSGFSAGIGLKFHLYKKIKLFIEYDGQLGFENILMNRQGDSPSNISESINVGLNFAVK